MKNSKTGKSLTLLFLISNCALVQVEGGPESCLQNGKGMPPKQVNVETRRVVWDPCITHLEAQSQLLKKALSEYNAAWERFVDMMTSGATVDEIKKSQPFQWNLKRLIIRLKRVVALLQDDDVCEHVEKSREFKEFESLIRCNFKYICHNLCDPDDHELVEALLCLAQGFNLTF